jgi:hypothetical protein
MNILAIVIQISGLCSSQTGIERSDVGKHRRFFGNVPANFGLISEKIFKKRDEKLNFLFMAAIYELEAVLKTQ